MAYFTVSRELVDPDYHDGVIASRREDLQFQTIVGRIKGQPVDWEQKVQVAAFPKARNAAVPEGLDFDRGTVKEYTDFVLAHVMEIFRSEGYRVTRHREKLKGHNDRATVAHKQAIDAQNLGLSIEVCSLSDQEAAEYGKTKMPLMRGAFNWLKPRGNAKTPEAVHAVYPIPLEILPTAGFEGNVTTGLTEEEFFKQARIAKKQRGTGNLTLVGLGGIDLKSHMTTWLAAASNINTGKLNRTQDADKKILQLICDDFVRDGIRIHMLNDDHVANDITGIPAGASCNAYSEQTAYQVGDYCRREETDERNVPVSVYYRCKTQTQAGAFDASKWEKLNPTWGANARSYLSGIFIDPTMWGFQTLFPMEKFDIVDEGGGPGGWHEATMRLTCLNPMGQFRVMDTAAAL